MEEVRLEFIKLTLYILNFNIQYNILITKLHSTEWKLFAFLNEHESRGVWVKKSFLGSLYFVNWYCFECNPNFIPHLRPRYYEGCCHLLCDAFTRLRILATSCSCSLLQMGYSGWSRPVFCTQWFFGGWYSDPGNRNNNL